MIIGIYWGYVAMIEGLARRIKAESWAAADRYCDGRSRDTFRQAYRVFAAIEPDLTIQGLSLLYDMTTRGSK